MTTMKFIGPSFVLDIPTNWFVFSSPQYQTLFLSPPTEDGQRANLTITIRSQDEPVTASEFAATVRSAYAQINTTVEMHHEETIDIEEVQGHLTIATLHNQETGSEVFQQQVIAITDGMIYVLNATRPTDLDEALATQIDELFTTMFKTFRFEQATLTT